uniref:Uncharacterized protein n=1 Tax=Sphaerodactylus townsendi TaxID=933632 RepID=A0ACB8ES96_9SAUR
MTCLSPVLQNLYKESISERPDHPGECSQAANRIKLTVEIQKDALLGHYGFAVSQNPPLIITSVVLQAALLIGSFCPGSHSCNKQREVENSTGEQAAAVLRKSEDPLRFTVLRCTLVNCLHVSLVFELLLGG